MIEPEMTFTDLDRVINLAERLIKYVINCVLDNNSIELKYLENYDKENKKEIISKLKRILDADFRRVDYGESIEILKKSKKKFVFDNIKWGMDLQSEHEKYLCRYFENNPIFIANYPIELKAFYMKNNSDGKTVSCFDLLLPEVGELVGGSMRESSYKILKEKAQKMGLGDSNLD